MSEWRPVGWEGVCAKQLLSEVEIVDILSKNDVKYSSEYRESLFLSFSAWWVRNVLVPLKDRVEEGLPDSVKGAGGREEVARELTLQLVSASPLSDVPDIMLEACLGENYKESK